MVNYLRDRSVVWLGVALCLAFVLPNHYSPWVSFHQEFAAAVAFVPLLAWASFQRHTSPALARGATALAFVPLAQLIFGHLYFSGDAWMSILYLLGFALSVYAGSCAVQQASETVDARLTRLTAVWVGLLLAALVSVALAAHQWLGLARLGLFIVDLPPDGRPFANLAQPNQLATLLLLGIAGLMFVWESGRSRAITTLAAVVLLVFGLAMTGSRSVLLTIVWLVPAYAALRRRCALRTTPSAFAFVLATYLVLSLSWRPLNDVLLLSEDASGALDRMLAPGIRSVYWTSMIDAIGRAPWAGYGWGQIGVAQTATALDYAATQAFFDSSHNLILDVALWSGVPVALVVSLGLALWFGVQVRSCATALSWVTLVAVAIVFTHAMVEYPLRYSYFLLPVGLWMGSLSGVSGPPLRMCSHPRRGAPVVLRPLAAMALLLMFVAVVAEYFPYEEDWRGIRFREARIGSQPPTDPPPHLLLTNLHELVVFARLAPQVKMSPQQLESMRKVSERYAYGSIMYRYALAQALNHDHKGAQLTLARICKMHTVSMCISARRDWALMAESVYPQLASVSFPVPSSP